MTSGPVAMTAAATTPISAPLKARDFQGDSVEGPAMARVARSAESYGPDQWTVGGVAVAGSSGRTEL